MDVNTLNSESPTSYVKRNISGKSFDSNSLQFETIVTSSISARKNIVRERSKRYNANQQTYTMQFLIRQYVWSNAWMSC